MKFTCSIIACATLAAFMAAAQPELKGTAEQLSQYLVNVPHVVTLMGEAELKKPADRALISLNVVTEHKLLQEASRANQELRARMLRSLGERGVPADRVQASKFSSTPKYGMFGEKAKSYRVENVVKIAANDEKEFQAVAGLVDSIPEVRYDSIEFEHSNQEELKRKALEQAIDKATEKQRLYEAKLGVKLTARGFAEAAGGSVTPLPARRAYEAKSYSSESGARPEFAATVRALEEVPTPFAELVYRAQVSIEFAVESK